MTFDICIVTDHSSKWIPACVRALSEVQYNCKNLSLFFANAASSDDLLQVLEREKALYRDVFSAFEILPQRETGGFGRACNMAAGAGEAEFVLFLNAGAEIFPDAFLHLERAVQTASPETAAFELRQFPCEHPKYYDPVTMEASWVNGACFAVRRSVWARAGGFDEHFDAPFFQEGRDAELSWHIRALGYRLLYVPSAAVWRSTCGSQAQETGAQPAKALCANLALRYKYGSQKQIKEGLRLARQALASAADETRTAAWKAGQQRLNGLRRGYRKFYRGIVQNSGFAPQFYGSEPEFARAGADYRIEPVRAADEKLPEITVVVRTFRRPESLRLTLQSLNNQTYRAFRVVVVEDGEEPVSRQAAEDAGAWFPVEYLAANSRWGRCRAGNEGVARARTEYVCFLDDDDYFFADHLEVMARAIAQHPDAGLWCAMAVEARCPAALRMQPVYKKNVGKDLLLPVDFFWNNPVPIQAVVFRRELYLECGGLDPEQQALEDWDLWMRMVCRAPVFAVGKATSIYRVPADSAELAARHRAIGAYREQLYRKMALYRLPLSAQDVYSLFWQPDESAQGSELNYEEWRTRAEELTNSHTWQSTRALRRMLLAAKGGMEKIAGPAPIRLDLAPAEELRAYCIMIEKSFCWRFASWLRRLLQFGRSQE